MIERGKHAISSADLIKQAVARYVNNRNKKLNKLENWSFTEPTWSDLPGRLSSSRFLLPTAFLTIGGIRL